jgi:hypothetical protein
LARSAGSVTARKYLEARASMTNTHHISDSRRADAGSPAGTGRQKSSGHKSWCDVLLDGRNGPVEVYCRGIILTQECILPRQLERVGHGLQQRAWGSHG